MVAKYGEDAVAYLPGGTPPKQKNSIIDDSWRQPSGPWILFSSLKAIAEGITLNEAHFIVLIELNPSFSKQEQFIYRIYRIGQENPLMTAYILCNTASRIEIGILNKHEFKKTAADEILDVDTNKPGSSKEQPVEVL